MGALSVMDRHLADKTFFAGERLTLADLALYANTHVAEEADLELTPFPAVREWLDRVAAHPFHVSFDWRPVQMA